MTNLQAKASSHHLLASAHTSRLSSPWPMDRVHGLRADVSWTWSRSQCLLRDAILTPTQLLVPTSEGLVALCVERGEERWSWQGNKIRRGALCEHGEHVLIQTTASQIVALERDTGRVRHTIELPHLHRVVALHRVHLGETPESEMRDGLLMLGERGTIALLDARDLTTIWTHAGGVRGPAQYALEDGILLMLQGNNLTRFDLVSGDVIWSEATPGSARHVLIHLDRAVLLHSGAQRAQTIVRGLHLDDARMMEEVSLDGYFLGSSCSLGEDLWLIIERHRRPVIEILRGQSLQPAWLRPLQEQTRSMAPRLTPISGPDGRAMMLVQTGASEVALFDGERGQMKWRSMQEPLMRAPLSALITRGACLYLGGERLCMRRTQGGEMLYAYEQFIDEPCLLLGCGELSVLLGESPLDDGPSTLIRLTFSPTLRVAYDRRRDDVEQG